MDNDNLIRLNSVLEQFQTSRSSWYKLISEGKAPKPIKYNRSSFWSQNEINEFIDKVKKEHYEVIKSRDRSS